MKTVEEVYAEELVNAYYQGGNEKVLQTLYGTIAKALLSIGDDDTELDRVERSICKRMLTLSLRQDRKNL